MKIQLMTLSAIVSSILISGCGQLSPTQLQGINQIFSSLTANANTTSNSSTPNPANSPDPTASSTPITSILGALPASLNLPENLRLSVKVETETGKTVATLTDQTNATNSPIAAIEDKADDDKDQTEVEDEADDDKDQTEVEDEADDDKDQTEVEDEADDDKDQTETESGGL